MTTVRRIAIAYSAILLGAAALNYIPGIRDEQGRCFGIFALDMYDDLLHLASAGWALGAALVSYRAARLFLIAFGALYLGDGLLGLLTGVGYLDFAIFTTGPLPLPLDFRILANTPHILLGAVALVSGLAVAQR
jgi:hypothetical protein